MLASKATSIALFLYDWSIHMGEKYARFLSDAAHVAPGQQAPAPPLMAQSMYLSHMINILWGSISKLMPLGKEDDVSSKRLPTSDD